MSNVYEVLAVGDGPVANALVSLVEVLGWSLVQATTLDEVEASLPAADAVVVLSHHEGLDGPAIGAALDAGTPYVGAMGSRRTQTRRSEWLLENGVTPEALATVRAPIGLDIGADEPGEIAVSILAELIAVRRGADDVRPVSARDGAIHPDLEPGTATCPGG